MDMLRYLEERFSKLDERLHSIDKTLVKQEENIAEHIRRTELLEQDLKPIKSHVNQVKGAGVFIGIAASLSALTAAVYNFLN